MEGGTLMVFRGGMRVVSVPAGAIACVDIAVEAAVGIQSSCFFIPSIRSCSKTPNFLVLQDLLW